MPERGFHSGFWTDPFVVKLPLEAKSLFAYLWTNDHCNQAGLYEISPETIANETKIPEDTLPQLFTLLEPKVKWYPEQNLVWVKNFIKRQTKNPKFLIAVAKSLRTINNNGAVIELLDYNEHRYSISIPYPYGIDSISIPTGLFCSDLLKGERGPEGEGGIDLATISVEQKREAQSIWQTCLTGLRGEVSKANYRTWLENTVGLLSNGGEFYLAVPSRHVGEYLIKNQRSLIEKHLGEIIGSPARLVLTVVKETPEL
ncbi:hypothetical protein ES703_98199 [subsurface metagenome]